MEGQASVVRVREKEFPDLSIFSQTCLVGWCRVCNAREVGVVGVVGQLDGAGDGIDQSASGGLKATLAWTLGQSISSEVELEFRQYTITLLASWI